MNKPYNIQNTNLCNGIFHISLLINEGEKTPGRKDPGANGNKDETTRIRLCHTSVACFHGLFLIAPSINKCQDVRKREYRIYIVSFK